MKKTRGFILILCCLLMLGALAACPVQAAATYKNELVKVKIKGSSPKDYNYYYYNKKGKKLKNTWKKVKVKGKTRKFYFGKNGKAYKAEKDASFKYNVAVKKIKGTKYGFDTNGYLVNGLYVSAGFGTGKMYYFSKTGKLNASVTAALQKAAKQGADSAVLRRLMKKYAGKPKKTYTTDVCTTFEGVEPLSATVDQYGSFEVQYFLMPDDREVVYMVAGALR